MIMLLNFATKASELEGDKSVIAGLELHTMFKNSCYIGFPTIHWYIVGIKASLEDRRQV